MTIINQHQLYHRLVPVSLALPLLFALASCGTKAGPAAGGPAMTPTLPVLAVQTADATVYQEYATSLEGMQDIEIRPQVDGYLDKVYVDEGSYVRKGQLLFHINDRPFAEQLNTAKAALTAAKAQMLNAEINYNKLKPLVENNIVSPVQLKTAQAGYDAAKASVEQAQAMVHQAEINLGFTSIKAPVEGYIGRIPHRTGSLVGMSTSDPLTVLSEIKEVYAYFSLSESDYLRFQEQFPGKTFEEKIRQMPPVQLMMANGSLYPQPGKVQLMTGQFDQSTGAVSLRAVFPNPDRLLRSGITGRIRLPMNVKQALVVPQEATYTVQDKVFVFVVGDSNKVASKPLQLAGQSNAYYFVSGGVSPGEKIVYSGAGNLQEGMMIQPQLISTDSLLKVRPL